MQMLVNFTCEQNLKLKHFYYLDGTLAGVVSQHSINPLRLKINTPCSLIHYSPKKKRKKKKSQTSPKCYLFCFFVFFNSGESSERSVQLTLAAGWLCSANNAHPQTDPSELSRRLHTSMSEPRELNAASVSHHCWGLELSFLQLI